MESELATVLFLEYEVSLSLNLESATSEPHHLFS